MTITAWPFQGTTVSDGQWALLMGLLSRSGGLDGVDQAGHFAVAVSSGLTVSVAAGNALGCGHGVSNSASADVTLDTAHATLARIDRVVIRLDMVGKTAVVGFVKGTAAGSPTVPALTQNTAATYEIPLANVTVPAAVTTLVSGNISDQRRVLAVDTNGVQAADITDSTSVGRALITAADAAAARTAISGAAATHTHAAADVDSGTLADARIPNLAASKITSGTLDDARLPTVPVTKGGTGATSASAARTALGATSIGAALFTASSVANARAELQIYVQASAPSSPSTGDLWFDY